MFMTKTMRRGAAVAVCSFTVLAFPALTPGGDVARKAATVVASVDHDSETTAHAGG